MIVRVLQLSLLTLIICGADYCPIPGSSFDHTLKAVVSYDWLFGRYIYYYSISNSAKSVSSIDAINVFTHEEPFAYTNLNKEWRGSYISQGLNSRVQWTTYESTAPETKDNRSGIRLPDYAIRPGERRESFNIQSRAVPGLVEYFVEGFQELAIARDHAYPDCPEIDLDNSLFRVTPAGITVGPQDPNYKSVKIRLRKNEGREWFREFDSKDLSGGLNIIVLSTKNFDATTIDIKTVRLGFEKVEPKSSAIVAPGLGGPFQDEQEDWERFSEIFVGNDFEAKSNLMLNFDVSELGLRCGLDRALVLRGKTIQGKAFIGGASVQLLGCDVRKPGIRPFHGERDPGC